MKIKHQYEYQRLPSVRKYIFFREKITLGVSKLGFKANTLHPAFEINSNRANMHKEINFFGKLFLKAELKNVILPHVSKFYVLNLLQFYYIIFTKFNDYCV